MKTKPFSLLFAIMASIGTLFAWDYEHVQIGELYYNLDSENHSAEVTYAEYANENNYAGLTTIDVPASIIYMNETYSVDSIEDIAFRECQTLTSVYIPSSIIRIDGNIFFGCNNLSSVIVADENPIYDSRDNCNGIIETATNCLVAGCPATNIPSDIVTLGAYCFGGLSTITYMYLPESLTTIEDGVFTFCTSLETIYIPKNVSHIGSYVFTANNLTNITVDAENTTYDSRNWCQAIISTETNTLLHGCKNTKIPNSVTSIARYAFAKCSGLTSITISEGVTSIDYSAFLGCKDLQSIVIPDNVVSIELDAFTDCTGLTSVEIGSGLDTITDPFKGCANIASIKVSEANNKFDSRDNCNAIIKTATNTLIRGCKNTIIPNSVTHIGNDAFNGCCTMTSIEIPNSITSIGYRAFCRCTLLESITIPEAITKIESGLFFGCSSLTSFTIPRNVTEIDGNAFYDCTGLTSITCKAITPPLMRALEVFYNVDKSIPLYVPAESIESYKAAFQWKDFTNILPIPGTETEDVNCNIRYIDKNSALVSSEQLTFHVPEAPEFEGFTFLRWEFVGGAMSDGLTIQAIYTANDPTSAPAEVVNPANKTQKLIREGNVYILRGDKTYTVQGQLVK